MVQRPPLPGFLAWRSFTYTEGIAAGATPSRMRARDLSAPSRQIRVPQGVGQKLLDRIRPYTKLSPGSAISHVTAAQLHGFPLPWFNDEITSVHLSRPAGSVQPRRKHVIGHSMDLPAEDIMHLGDVPITTPARTFLDLATILDLDDLVAVADFLVCEHERHFEARKVPIVAAAVLRSYIADKRWVTGLNKARAALELMRVGVDSPPETKLRLMLQRAGLPEFTTNYAIAGNPLVWPDLACEKYKTSAQYEGEIHQTTKKQLFDRNRDERTAARGWLQVKVYSSDMRQGEAHVVAMVEAALRRQGWRPGQI